MNLVKNKIYLDGDDYEIAKAMFNDHIKISVDGTGPFGGDEDAYITSFDIEDANNWGEATDEEDDPEYAEQPFIINKKFGQSEVNWAEWYNEADNSNIYVNVNYFFKHNCDSQIRNEFTVEEMCHWLMKKYQNAGRKALVKDIDKEEKKSNTHYVDYDMEVESFTNYAKRKMINESSDKNIYGDGGTIFNPSGADGQFATARYPICYAIMHNMTDAIKNMMYHGIDDEYDEENVIDFDDEYDREFREDYSLVYKGGWIGDALELMLDYDSEFILAPFDMSNLIHAGKEACNKKTIRAIVKNFVDITGGKDEAEMGITWKEMLKIIDEGEISESVSLTEAKKMYISKVTLRFVKTFLDAADKQLEDDPFLSRYMELPPEDDEDYEEDPFYVYCDNVPLEVAKKWFNRSYKTEAQKKSWNYALRRIYTDYKGETVTIYPTGSFESMNSEPAWEQEKPTEKRYVYLELSVNGLQKTGYNEARNITTRLNNNSEYYADNNSFVASVPMTDVKNIIKNIISSDKKWQKRIKVYGDYNLNKDITSRYL